MRRVQRMALDAKAGKYLLEKQSDANTKYAAKTLKPDAHWKSARQTKTMKRVLVCLQNMMGPRQRCMYCVDSHGCDIEHFQPKASFSKWMYRWNNLLLCCTQCGRLKGSKFPLFNSKPLLLDPSKEEPWKYLDFDPTTGNITARFDILSNAFQIKGEETVITLQLDRREALAVGYQQTYKKLNQRISLFLQTPTPPQILIYDLIEHDEHGLLGWFFKGNGQSEPILIHLKTQYPSVWKACVRAFKFR